MSAQHIRRSQFVLSAGPGAILEGVHGPRMIPRADVGLFKPRNLDPNNFVIAEPRMSQGLLENKKIFRIPSNAELQQDDSRYIYHTKQFPYWALCNQHWILHQISQGCPDCQASRRRRPSEAIRFVLACPDGHLDDISWKYLVHENKPCAADKGFNWIGGGSSLKNVEIECRSCHKKVNFGQAYNRDWKCWGRYPERESLYGEQPSNPPCDKIAKIVQRQAANLRVPEIVSLFTIPRCYTALHKLLQIGAVYHNIKGRPPSSEDEFNKVLENLYSGKLIGENTYQQIRGYRWQEISKAISDVVNQPLKSSYEELINEEFHALVDASVQGVPPVKSPRPTAETLFEVEATEVKRFKINNLNFRVTPVRKLNTLIVQKGYKRIDPTLGKFVDISFRDDAGQDWLPGVHFLGEGIFIMLDDYNGQMDFSRKTNAKKWISCQTSQNADYPETVFRDPRKRSELHPNFVWWHTLAHLLIRVLAIDSGYSSAAIRERIYHEKTPNGVRSGIILYAVQPGKDGTLGGLITLVPSFDKLLSKALDLAQHCSNDPLCEEQEQSFSCGKSFNGAACYGCLLVSETSCEHRNMWLDRSCLKD